MMRKIFVWLLSVNIILLIGSIVWADKIWIVNMEIGFVSAALVVGASMFGYWQMVQGSGDSEAHFEVPDFVDAIDDKFDLFNNDEENKNKDVKTVFKEEKVRLKNRKRSFKNFIKTSKPAISLYRLAGYGILIGGFFYLLDGKMLNIPAYFTGLLASPLAIAVGLWRLRH